MAGWWEDVFQPMAGRANSNGNALEEIGNEVPILKDVIDQVSRGIKEQQEQSEISRKQTEIARQQKAEGDLQKRKIQEKQIRSLRRNYRAHGFGLLGSNQPTAQDMNSKLGG